MYDLHCHILPGIDDGPESAEETREMLQTAVQEGISIIAATLHFSDEQSTVDSYLAAVEEKTREVQPLLSKLDTDIQIVSGAEVFMSPMLPSLEGLEKLCINDTQYLLIELPMMDIPQYAEDLIYSLRIRGMIPIIAHPERNFRIMDNPNLLAPMIELGALAQINSGSITGQFGKRVRQCARILFDHNMAHLISSDAHSPNGRAPRLKEAAERLDKWLGTDLADEVLDNTPRAILNDVLLEMDSPISYRKRKFYFPFFTG
jgi:protein-tyrosine phosphatase